MEISNKKKVIAGAAVFAVCICLSALLTTALIKRQLIYNQHFGLHDFELEDIVSLGNNTIMTLEDSHMIMQFDKPSYILGVEIDFDNISELEWDLQTFWDDGSGYSEEHSITHHVSATDEICFAKLYKRAEKLRIDLGDISGNGLRINDIKIKALSGNLYENPIVLIPIIAVIMWAFFYRVWWLFSHKHKMGSCKIILEIAASIFVFALISQGIAVATFYLSKPESYEVRHGFYESDDSEVLFIGTSHMFNAVYPMELWRDYGISSYNLANAGERMALTYYSLKDAINVRKPKAVVIDVHGLKYGDQKNDPEVPKRSHVTFDAMKWGKIKVEGIVDCVEKQYRSGFFFPLAFYHNRWTELTKDDIDRGNSFRSLSRGASYLVNVGNEAAPTLVNPEDYTFKNNYSTEYLEKIVALCAEKDIPVLIIYIPFRSPAGNQRAANMAADIAKKYDNATYLNLLYNVDEFGLDYAIDTADKMSHLNPSGARKVTGYLGKYLSEHYDLSDYRGDTKWQDQYERYRKLGKDPYFELTTDFESYLMLLADPDYSCMIYLPEDFGPDRGLISKLFDNIELYGDMTVMKAEDLASESVNGAMAQTVIDVYTKDGIFVNRSVWNNNLNRIYEEIYENSDGDTEVFNG
ncbi:MAG: hypothetical protein K6A74_02945 [Lachnospiraceae bacterium]|nr:hypothetical protein [Lachnospiraceae bacterium]